MRWKMNKYICEKENQKYVDSKRLKSKCCQEHILATTLEDYYCLSCGELCEVEE